MDAAETRSARDRVLLQLKTSGPQTAGDLARRLSVTPVAVRQHLQALLGERLVEFLDERRGVGRPARVWSLAEAAASRFPDSHSDLTVELLAAARSTFGEEGLDLLLTERTRRQRLAYSARLPGPNAPIEQKLDALARIRREEGYMCEWQQEADGSYLLVENHCPICAAAKVCQGFCRDELSMFREVLGEAVTVDRTDHILAGARRCAYRIGPASKASSPPASARESATPADSAADHARKPGTARARRPDEGAS